MSSSTSSRAHMFGKKKNAEPRQQQIKYASGPAPAPAPQAPVPRHFYHDYNDNYYHHHGYYHQPPPNCCQHCYANNCWYQQYGCSCGCHGHRTHHHGYGYCPAVMPQCPVYATNPESLFHCDPYMYLLWRSNFMNNSCNRC